MGFKNSFRSRFHSASRGMAMMEGGPGSFIAYATSPGFVSAEGTVRNGVFTAHLLKNIETPGLPIEEVFKRTWVGVVQTIKTLQTPWQASSLLGKFYFAELSPMSFQNKAASAFQSKTIKNLPNETQQQKMINVAMGKSLMSEMISGRRATTFIDGPLHGMKFTWISPGDVHDGLSCQLKREGH